MDTYESILTSAPIDSIHSNKYIHITYIYSIHTNNTWIYWQIDVLSFLYETKSDIHTNIQEYGI